MGIEANLPRAKAFSSNNICERSIALDNEFNNYFCRQFSVHPLSLPGVLQPATQLCAFQVCPKFVRKPTENRINQQMTLFSISELCELVLWSCTLIKDTITFSHIMYYETITQELLESTTYLYTMYIEQRRQTLEKPDPSPAIFNEHKINA